MKCIAVGLGFQLLAIRLPSATGERFCFWLLQCYHRRHARNQSKMKAEDWQRAGFVERNGQLERIENANRTVPKAAPADIGGQGHDSELQKQQNVDCEITQRQAVGATVVDHEAGIPGGYETDREQFRVTITFRFSNQRRTDLSGKLDTILDCIVHARRRLLGDNPTNSGASRNVRSRKRRSNNHNRTVVEGPLPF